MMTLTIRTELDHAIENMTDHKNRRSRIGLIDPERQLRFAFYLIGGGITTLMLICLYLLVSLENNLQAVLNRAQVPTDVSEVLIDHVGSVELNVTAISLFLMAVSVFIGVKLSHRIYGPIVQMRKHVGRLMAGEYQSRVHLRDHDHFGELADDLNDLAQTLESRK